MTCLAPKAAAAVAAVFMTAMATGAAQAQDDGARWFQVEMSVFINESPIDHNSEYWSVRQLELGFPPRIRPFNRVSDFLMVEDFDRRVTGGAPSRESATGTGNGRNGRDGAPDRGSRVEDSAVNGIDARDFGTLELAPRPLGAPADLRLPDLQREPYYLLPASASDFQQTNRALERSADYRLLFHGVWRQPVLQARQALPLFVSGGQRVGDRHELEGSVAIRFTPSRDRVVLDANLWLADFSTVDRSTEEWELPPLPAFARSGGEEAFQQVFYINRIVQLKQSREMRSNEFHYVDHPAIGILIEVKPYEVPPRELPENVIPAAF